MYADLMDTIGFVAAQDKEVGDAMQEEPNRQRGHLELIASENNVSPAVMAVLGSRQASKKAEGAKGERE